MPLDIGTALGPYEILAPIGAGGMGDVYKAKDTRLGREVAVKVLHSDKVGDEERRQRFIREARAASQLNHPNIAAVYDIAEAEGIQFIVMEYVPGKTLARTIVPKGMGARLALRYAWQTAEALAKAHGAGIIHRDIKPANIMITDDGVVKVLDFGLAKLEEPVIASDTEKTLTAMETQAGVILGTVAYMSPEQAQGHPADARSDIFSFGVVLYEMLTGRRPFSRETSAQTLAAIIESDVPTLADSTEPVPAGLSLVVSQCLQKRPEQRFQSAHDLAITLRALSSDSQNRLLVPTIEDLPPRRRVKRLALGAVAAVLVAILAVVGARSLNQVDTSVRRLVVLPFVNDSGDTSAEYLSDGLTEGIINRLSKSARFAVMSSNSSLQFKDKRLSAQEIGRELDVDAILIGRIVQRGDSLSVNVELVDGKNNQQLWGDRYSYHLDEINSAQNDIAREIVRSLGIRLTGAEEELLNRRYTDNAEAYRLYLRGRFQHNKMDADSLQQAISFFEQAIEKDPDYALSYAGIADAYAVLAFYGHLPPVEAYPKAEVAAMRAIVIDEGLAEAHAALGHVKLNFSWDWPGAERALERAIELRPNYATGRLLYSTYLARMGRSDEALGLMSRARELDPVSLTINTNIGLMLHLAGRQDEAITELRKTLEMDASFIPAYNHLAWAYLENQMHDEAIAVLETALSFDDSSAILGDLGRAYAISGNSAEALKILEKMNRLAADQLMYVSPLDIALVHAGLGDKELAFACLERAYTEKVGWLGYLTVDRRFKNLRSDPRFRRLAERMKLIPGN